MTPSDPQTTTKNTYWWIISLAMSVTCCSVLFVWFSNYIYQVREELAVAKAHFEVAESRINEMSLDLQMLNHRNNVQQIQIVPNGTAQSPAPDVIATPSPPPVPAPPETPSPAPAKH